jgi:site-specific DNA recombinase
LVDDYASGLLTRAELAQAKVMLERQIERVQEELAELQPLRALEPIPAGQNISEVWQTRSLAWRRTVLSLLVERVVIKPVRRQANGNYHGFRFSPDGVEILWKH